MTDKASKSSSRKKRKKEKDVGDDQGDLDLNAVTGSASAVESPATTDHDGAGANVPDEGNPEVIGASGSEDAETVAGQAEAPVDQPEADHTTSVESSGSEPAAEDAEHISRSPRPNPFNQNLFSRLSSSPMFDVKRLSVPENFDRFVYILILISGAIIIFLLKLFLPQVSSIAMILSLVLISAYAFYVFFVGQLRIRRDKGGDNCYYLGLTFTLVGMLAALLNYEDIISSSQLLSYFGLALSSTIFGIIFRLILIQYQDSVDNIEERARISLASAAAALEQDLAQARSEFEAFTFGLRENIRGEMTGFTQSQIADQKQLVEDINKVLAETVDALKSSTEKIEQSFETHTTIIDHFSQASESTSEAVGILNAKVQALDLPEDLFTRSFGSASDQLVTSAENLSKVVSSLDEVKDRINESVEGISKLSDGSTSAAQAMTSMSDSSSKLQNEVDRVSGLLGQLGNNVERDNESVSKQLAALQENVVDYAKVLSEVADILAKEIGNYRAQ